jgi:glycosyltransferase involved in cell wall biosynthesis
MPIISIVIPIYNQEKYLRKCLDSIVAQTFRDFEVILVDDGSTDASAEICKEYAQRDNRFAYFHKENGGVSAARQFGHDHVRGEYSIHCDPDDWVEPDWLEALHTEAVHTNADITICDFYREYKDRSQIIRQQVEASDPKAVRRAMFGHIHGSCWNKLIKTACYKRNNVNFPKDINYLEDLSFIVRLLNFCSVVSYVNKPLYHYFMNPQSITHSYTKGGIANFIRVSAHVRALIDDEVILKNYDDNQAYSMLWYAWNCSDMSSSEFKQFSKAYRWRLLSVKVVNKKRKLFLVMASFGPTGLVKRAYKYLLKRRLNCKNGVIDT